MELSLNRISHSQRTQPGGRRFAPIACYAKPFPGSVQAQCRWGQLLEQVERLSWVSPLCDTSAWTSTSSNAAPRPSKESSSAKPGRNSKSFTPAVPSQTTKSTSQYPPKAPYWFPNLAAPINSSKRSQRASANQHDGSASRLLPSPQHFPKIKFERPVKELRMIPVPTGRRRVEGVQNLLGLLVGGGEELAPVFLVEFQHLS
jgi:hypothetical protein